MSVKMNTLLGALVAVVAVAAVGSADAATMIAGSGITVTASDTNSNSAFANGFVVDGSGITANYGDTGTEWFTNIGQVRNDTWIAFDLGAAYVLDSMHVWNANRYNTWGIDQVDIYVSAVAAPGDPEGAGAANWTQIATNVNFAQAPYRSADAGFDLETQTGITLPTTAVRHVRFEVDSAFDGQANGYTGLNEVQFFEADVVPEPASLALLIAGFGLCGLPRRRS